MVNVIRFSAIAAVAALVAGCAPRAEPVAPPPPVIQPEPSFNKF